MLAMCHFSWRRTKSMLEGRSRNKTITAKDSKLTVLERICSKTKYQSPCQPNQLWECVTMDRRQRLRKCRRNATAPTNLPTPSTITPVKMCVCMKRRPDSDVNVNQGDMLPYEGECSTETVVKLHDVLCLMGALCNSYCNSARIWLILLL